MEGEARALPQAVLSKCVCPLTSLLPQAAVATPILHR